MILPLSARFSSANLPTLGERVVYASGPRLISAGVVQEVRPVLRGTIWILFREDTTGDVRRVRPQNLFREEQCK